MTQSTPSPDPPAPAPPGAGGAAPAAPGVWRIPTPLPFRPSRVHAYLARLDGGDWLLVDGGLNTPEAWAALEAGLAAAGAGWSDVGVHVVTHMHMDHVGLAARVRDASGARVLMGRLDAERMAWAAAHPDDEAAYRAELLRRGGAPADAVEAIEAASSGARSLAAEVAVDGVLDGDVGEVPGAPGWRFAWTPGHTAGHVSLFRPADGVLVAGDAVLPRITPTLGVNRQRADPVGDYLEALDRLEALAPKLVLPGHGDPPADGIARIRGLRQAALAEADAVLALVGAEPAAAWEVALRRHPGPDLPASTRMLALRETLAHLHRLAAAGRLGRETGPEGAELFRRA